jgi:ectoine hydroxylase-related dioxygenase (phytanoyl-CoA dioxygenase family)
MVDATDVTCDKSAEFAAAIEREGYARIMAAYQAAEMTSWIDQITLAMSAASANQGRLESRGTAYAARNVLEIFPAAAQLWKTPELQQLLQTVLGPNFGLVRVLFFDKPPGRTWSLGWHKDMTIAVVDNSLPSTHFRNPTRKSGVPHVIAPQSLLDRMLTLRVHLDEVNDENGPLLVIPGSHRHTSDLTENTMPHDTIHAQPGDVLAMRPLLTHASGNSLPDTTKHRRILHYEFATNAELPDEFRWHTFIS